ncbi:hypothetical protein [Kutzneria sp. 744]|uniref:hypothetical protein n=1 Tax=Kutzneria sp. (strain 744) TaxID=345341 RepID=UPI0003EEA51C|nr:hypothetical protein [Kutzneria sp. 744]EWM18425.1 hypothetical protein KUTG_08729 [Kutzneria sp. 744]
MSTSVVEVSVEPVPEVRADKVWFRWCARHPVASVLVVGFVATQMATTLGYFMPAIGLPELPWPLHNGIVAAPNTPEGTAASYAVGQFMHYLDGMAFTLVFAFLAHPRLPFRDTEAGNFLKAQVFCTILALIAITLLVPFIYAPGKGFGIFSFGHGWQFPFAVWLWHLIFGAHIGALYNPGRVRRQLIEDRVSA